MIVICNVIVELMSCMLNYLTWFVELMSCMLNCFIFDMCLVLIWGKCLNLCFERLGISFFNSLKPFGIKNTKGKVPNQSIA